MEHQNRRCLWEQIEEQEENIKDEFVSPIKELTYDEVTEPIEKNVASYELSEMDWAEYLTHFTYLVEGLKDYIKIYTEDTPKPILSLMSMKSMEELLPPTRFMRVHRSFIVQKDKIRIIDRGRIVFDKTYIPVSDSYKQAFQAFLDERS